MNLVLAAESRLNGPSSASLTPSLPVGSPFPGTPDLIIDLTGQASTHEAPVLTVEINGWPYLPEAFPLLRSGSCLVDITARLDGKPIARASPMMTDRVWLSRDADALFAAAQSLIVHSIARFETGRLDGVHVVQAKRAPRFLAPGYVRRLAIGLGTRALRRLKPGYREFSWETGYRLIDGPGIAENGALRGAPFTVLPDDGKRFYADPFPIEHEGRHYLFVEEFPYDLGRGVISVAELDGDGKFGRPRVVLEEPYHLSYPNVFAHEGAMFMIPESGSARRVVLYRAECFPDRWTQDTVLLDDRGFNDATLVEHEGRLWMFGTERFGSGSASDTMMIYSAATLRGPWEPHPLNPIVIDRAGARPGGRFVNIDGRIFLPVQDGTETYGGGLGLRELIKLDSSDVEFGPVSTVMEASLKAPASIHTLNRAGRLEVIDGLR